MKRDGHKVVGVEEHSIAEEIKMEKGMFSQDKWNRLWMPGLYRMDGE